MVPVESESDYFTAFSSLLRSGVSSVTYDTVSELAAGSLEALLRSMPNRRSTAV